MCGSYIFFSNPEIFLAMKWMLYGVRIMFLRENGMPSNKHIRYMGCSDTYLEHSVNAEIFFLKCCGFWTLHICRMVDPPASPVEVAKLFWHNSITAVARSGQKNRCFHATCQQLLFLLRKTRHLKGLKGRFIGFLRGLNALNMLQKITLCFKDTKIQ